MVPVYSSTVYSCIYVYRGVIPTLTITVLYKYCIEPKVTTLFSKGDKVVYTYVFLSVPHSSKTT